MAASAVQAEPGTEDMASVGLSRKETFRSSTEACKFMWMCVMESLCFLRVKAWPSVAWGHHPGSTIPWAHRHTMTDSDTGREGTGIQEQPRNEAGLLPPGSMLCRCLPFSGGSTGKEKGVLSSSGWAGLAPGQGTTWHGSVAGW